MGKSHMFENPIALRLFKHDDDKLDVGGPCWSGCMQADQGEILKGRKIDGKCPWCDSQVTSKLLLVGINYYAEEICQRCLKKFYILFQKEGWGRSSLYYLSFVRKFSDNLLSMLQPITDYEDPRDYIINKLQTGELRQGEYSYEMYEQIQRELAIRKNKSRF